VEVTVVGIVGGKKAGVGGGGPDDVMVAEGRIGVGDRLRVGSLTGLGGGGPFSGPRRLEGPEGPEVRRDTASASDSSSRNCSMSLDKGESPLGSGLALAADAGLRPGDGEAGFVLRRGAMGVG